MHVHDCVCVCVCLYVYTYFIMCVQLYIYVYIHIYIFVCICMCACVGMLCKRMCVRVSICMYASCVYIYVCVCMYVCMCVYVCMCIHFRVEFGGKPRDCPAFWRETSGLSLVLAGNSNWNSVLQTHRLVLILLARLLHALSEVGVCCVKQIGLAFFDWSYIWKL